MVDMSSTFCVQIRNFSFKTFFKTNRFQPIISTDIFNVQLESFYCQVKIYFRTLKNPRKKIVEL